MHSFVGCELCSHFSTIVIVSKIAVLHTIYTTSCFIALSTRPTRVCVCVHACFHTPPTSTVSTVKAFSEHPSQHHIQSCRALHEAQHYIRNQPNHSASHCVRLRKLLPTMGQVHLSSKHSCKGLKTAARPSRLSHPLMTSPVLLSIPEPNPGPVG